VIQNNFSILLAVVTAITWGISNGFMKVPSLAIGSARAIMMRQFWMIFVLLIPFFVILPGLQQFWLVISLLLGCFGYLPFYFICQAMQLAPIGIVNAIGNTFPLIVSILSFYFYGIELTKLNWVGIVLTVSGVFVLSLFRENKSKHRSAKDLLNARKANIYAILACLLWGIFFTLIQLPNKELGFVPLVFTAQLGTLISAFIHSLFISNRRNIGKKSLQGTMKAAFVGIIGSLCYYKALMLGNPSIVTGIAGCSPIISAFFGIYAYNERLLGIQWLGVLLSIIGVVLLK
jgi:drug/metabolite transporter (DMT)-like permease